jgi:hypothetical protein
MRINRLGQVVSVCNDFAYRKADATLAFFSGLHEEVIDDRLVPVTAEGIVGDARRFFA